MTSKSRTRREDNPTFSSRLELPEAPDHESGPVKAWYQSVELLSYLPQPPDKNPMFLETRVYQGSSGRVYPLPFIDRISEEPTLHSWQAIHIENKYLRLVILPEIGGRIHVGLDKINQYDFFYRQNVIKPALVGLAGPWISGGVEFNWPQHHRPATFMPVDTEIERHSDGSVTIWCNDYDPLQRMKGMHGICLHPDTAVLEVKVRLYNRTSLTQTFLWWANTATRVHERYQSFFPPDVRYVADHAKRAITSFPHSDRPYYGIDYPKRMREGIPDEDKPEKFRPDGTYAADDLSWYANIPVPTSYMVTSTKENWFGGYDHAAEAGVLHYADHHIAPGKKQWTWGNHNFGYAWDRSLTDNDGPYIELMAGVYTDNQPDFSFLAPGETKSFSQYWYPLRRIGPPKAACLDCALNVALESHTVYLSVQSTKILEDVTVELFVKKSLAASWTQSLMVEKPLLEQVEVPSAKSEFDLKVHVSQGSKLLLRYAPVSGLEAAIPTIAAEPEAPSNISSADLLFLTGLHLAQYRHATRRPESYWEEALRRDDGDVRCNTAMGRLYLERGEFRVAGQYLKKAIQRNTLLNPNPMDGESYYLLGVVLRFCGQAEESYAAFSKATWNDAWKGAAHYALAQLEMVRERWDEAWLHVERSLRCNIDNLNARNIAVIVLRRLKRDTEADRMLSETRALDRLDDWSTHLEYGVIPKDNRTMLDLAWDYSDSGETEVAITILQSADLTAVDGSVPIIFYTLGHLLDCQGYLEQAAAVRRKASLATSDYCFPHGLHDLLVLESAIRADSSDGRAQYYLGNLFYDRRRHEEAIEMWSRAAKVDSKMPTIHRNLGIALFNVRADVAGAMEEFDLAQENDPNDGRILYERDQLWKRTGVEPEIRLRELLKHVEQVEQRDDLAVELAALYNQIRQPQIAFKLLLSREFQPWEGGEGLVLGQFTRSLLLLAKQDIRDGKPNEAIQRLELALQPPSSLGEARHLLANKSDVEYWLGIANDDAGNRGEAEYWWKRASRATGDFQQMSVVEISEMSYWKGAALSCLGSDDEAKTIFHSIQAFAEALDAREPKIDYFATSLPAMLLFHEDIHRRQQTHATFLRAQATLGLRGFEEARPWLERVLEMDANHAGASDLLQEMSFEGSLQQQTG